MDENGCDVSEGLEGVIETDERVQAARFYSRSFEKLVSIVPR